LWHGDLLVPGSIDWDRTFDRIIYETVDNAYNEVLDSVRKSLIRAKTITEQKGRAATLAATMLLIQILALVFAVLQELGIPQLLRCL